MTSRWSATRVNLAIILIYVICISTNQTDLALDSEEAEVILQELRYFIHGDLKKMMRFPRRPTLPLDLPQAENTKLMLLDRLETISPQVVAELFHDGFYTPSSPVPVLKLTAAASVGDIKPTLESGSTLGLEVPLWGQTPLVTVVFPTLVYVAQISKSINPKMSGTTRGTLTGPWLFTLFGTSWRNAYGFDTFSEAWENILDLWGSLA